MYRCNRHDHKYRRAGEYWAYCSLEGRPQACYAREMALVRVDCLPRHVAIIMDGNGRWAQQRKKPRTFGHREGSEAVRRVVRASRRLGIKALTLYAFSEQNWLRPMYEVQTLMNLFKEFLIKERPEIIETNIRVRAIGRLHRLPAPVREILDQLVADTTHLQGMTLQLAVSYGGQEEIVDAVKRLVQRVREGKVDPRDLDEGRFASELPSAEAGPVDLLIRTGGEYRISNFLLWESAYAELYFSQTLWPDFGEAELYEAITSFQQRERRFGRVLSADQVVSDETVERSTSRAHV
jgi:undecaprenyl diphosphate synthase